MVQLVGATVRVVDTGPLTIDELAGNVATKNDRISIALVKIAEPTSEPWLTLHYDEWMCVLKGRMVLLHGEGSLEVRAGQTVFIAKGERFRPTFPDGDTEYVPVCLPAFRPDRCIREETESDVSTKLQELHGEAGTGSSGGYLSANEDPSPDFRQPNPTLSSEAKAFVWPHVFGGIHPQVVEAIFPMERNGSAFLGITGLTSVQRVFKLATAAEVQRFEEEKQVLSGLDEKESFTYQFFPIGQCQKPYR
eukprot:g23015.t1